MARTKVRRTSRWVVSLPWAGMGLAFGYLFGASAVAFSVSRGGSPPPGVPQGVALACGLTAYLISAWFIEGSGDLARRVFMGGDRGTAPEYSAARALEVRGDFDAAVRAFGDGAADHPDDPEPLIEGARLLARHLDRPDEAERWLDRAAAIPDMNERALIRVNQARVEFYVDLVGQPRRALPILARMAEINAGTRPGEWAARRLAHLRTQVWENVRDDHTEELTDYQRKMTGR